MRTRTGFIFIFYLGIIYFVISEKVCFSQFCCLLIYGMNE